MVRRQRYFLWATVGSPMPEAGLTGLLAFHKGNLPGPASLRRGGLRTRAHLAETSRAASPILRLGRLEVAQNDGLVEQLANPCRPRGAQTGPLVSGGLEAILKLFL